MKAVVAAFNQEKALVGAFSVITNLRMQLFEALLEDTWLAAAWLQLLSHCPWLTITKLTFSNTLVREKRSSRAHVQYVGGLLEPRVWRYYTCLHAEVGLLALDSLVPGLVPDFIWDICTR